MGAKSSGEGGILGTLYFQGDMSGTISGTIPASYQGVDRRDVVAAQDSRRPPSPRRAVAAVL